MKRIAALSFAVAVIALAAVASASAEANGYGPWESAEQGPITAPAGVVCPFTVTAEPLFQNFRVRYHYDANGNVDGYQVQGPLIAKVTNTETGTSVRRNLTGFATVTFSPDGSYDAIVEGGFLVFFLAQDTPSHELLFMPGRTILHGDPSGSKTLVSTAGPTENLCETLA